MERDVFYLQVKYTIPVVRVNTGVKLQTSGNLLEVDDSCFHSVFHRALSPTPIFRKDWTRGLFPSGNESGTLAGADRQKTRRDYHPGLGEIAPAQNGETVCWPNPPGTADTTCQQDHHYRQCA